jgi:large subunit ribosomal protein L24
MKGEAGGIVDKDHADRPVERDAVQPGATGKGDRVGIKTLEDGKKVRFFKSNGEQLVKA